jgi:hypothetical protein
MVRFRPCPLRVRRTSSSPFGLRWFELPAAFAVAVAVHVLEIGGMMAAFDDSDLASG